MLGSYTSGDRACCTTSTTTTFTVTCLSAADKHLTGVEASEKLAERDHDKMLDYRVDILRVGDKYVQQQLRPAAFCHLVISVTFYRNRKVLTLVEKLQLQPSVFSSTKGQLCGRLVSLEPFLHLLCLILFIVCSNFVSLCSFFCIFIVFHIFLLVLWHFLKIIFGHFCLFDSPQFRERAGVHVGAISLCYFNIYNIYLIILCLRISFSGSILSM